MHDGAGVKPRPGRTTLHDPVCMRVRLTTLPKILYHVLFLTNQRIPLTIVGLFRCCSAALMKSPLLRVRAIFFIDYDISIPDHAGYSRGVIRAATEPLLMPPAQWESERDRYLPSLGSAESRPETAGLAIPECLAQPSAGDAPLRDSLILSDCRHQRRHRHAAAIVLLQAIRDQSHVGRSSRLRRPCRGCSV